MDESGTMSRFWRLLIAVILSLGLLHWGVGNLGAIPLHQASAATPPNLQRSTQPNPTLGTPELRGVWLTNIDSDVLFSKANLKQALERLRRLNFNTIYPTVFNGGHTLYPSAVAQVVWGKALDPEPGLQGRDLLAEAVTEGHRLGLTVIPWLEFGLMLPDTTPLLQRHPDWIAKRADGSDVWLEGQRIPRRWLNPFHPQVQQLLSALVAEIVSRYDVDGIQWDDHLGLPVEFGYDAYTVKLYQREHQGRRPPSNPTDPEWVRWRANKITALVAQLFHTVKALNPKVIVALSPNPQEFAYSTYLQDWQRWEREGYVEEVMVQVYRNDLSRFVADINHPTVQRAKANVPTGIGILAGLKGRTVPMVQIAAQVEQVRKAGLAGVAFFFYESLFYEAASDRELGGTPRDFRKLFPTPVPRP